MRNLPIFRFCAYATFLSSASAFSVTFGTPTQCDPFTISWTGGQAPFQILVTPFNHPLLNVTVPSSAFSGEKGSYPISQLPLASGTQFLLTMSDAIGFGSGGTTTILTVGAPIANNICNTAGSQDFSFSTSGAPQQCSTRSRYTFYGYDNATLPVNIMGLIPGGTPLVINSVTITSYPWVVNVRDGTNLLFFITDSRPGTSSVSPLYTVQPSSDTSCLNANWLSSTVSAPSQTPIESTPSDSQTRSSSNTSSVGIIAGAAVGGGALLILLIVLGIYCKRKAPRSSDITSSPKRQSRRLQHNGGGREVIQDSQVMQDVIPRQQTDRYRVTHHQLMQPGSQSHLSNAPATDHVRQHIRHFSDIDSFAGSSTAMGDQIAPPNTFLDQRLPVGLAPPVHPGTHSHLTNTSVSNFAVNDSYDSFTQIRPSRLSTNIDGFTMHASDGHLSFPSSGQMTAMAGQASSPNNSFPYQTAPAHFAPTKQPGTLSHHPSASNFTVSDGASPLNSTQALRLSSNIDGFSRHSGAGSSPMLSFGERIATAAGATGTNPPPQIVMHVDSEEVPAVPDAQDVIELPPQYVEQPFLVAESASVPNQKSSY